MHFIILLRLKIMIGTSCRVLLLVLFFSYFSYAISDNVPIEDVGKLTEDVARLTEDVGKLTENVARLTEDLASLAEHSGGPTEDEVSKGDDALIGNSEAGKTRYKKSCINCHGAAGKGVASYPKISGQEISYTTLKLETYRDGIEIGPNSSLMIMMAKPLTDEEIANLAAYLKDVTS